MNYYVCTNSSDILKYIDSIKTKINMVILAVKNDCGGEWQSVLNLINISYCL